MQLKIRILPEENCELPLAYHHILQSSLYRLMAEENQQTSLHDHGAVYNKRTYKLFTFGLLRGQYRIQQGRICFNGLVEVEVRSVDGQLLKRMQDKLKEEGILLSGSVYRQVEAEVEDRRIDSSRLQIQMDSPICVCTTDPQTKQTYFYSPQESKFTELVNQNFRHKYEAAYGEKPSEDIRLFPVRFGKRDKYVTKYKEFYLSGWKGIYQLEGRPEYLDFLYQSGLGAKNSQGFGMFDVRDRLV